MPKHEYYLPSRKMVSQQDQEVIARPDVPRSKFSGSWSRLTTFDAGHLYPILVDEILPGDHMRYNVTAYVRMATPLFPLFSNQRVDTHFFFVPNRLVWSNWKRFMGEQPAFDSSIVFTIPQIVSPAGGFIPHSIYDHMGLPCVGQITAGQTITINALPLRAYSLIYQEWFRDQNIFGSAQPPVTNGPDAEGIYIIRPRAKSHDYFTSALPWPQKFTGPTLFPGGLAPVVGIGTLDNSFLDEDIPVTETLNATTGQAAVYGQASQINAPDQPGVNWFAEGASAVGPPLIFADLSAGLGITVSAFRQAMMIQSLLERDARGGTRYTEILRAHFGVVSPDARMQRPEYIGGGSSMIAITPIAQTAPQTGEDEPGVGALGAAGTAVGTHSASYASTEHGYIIGLISVRTELAYQQGIPRTFSRQTRFDYYWPSLALLGEQAILRQEIYATGTDAEDSVTFGYQERWHEYRGRYSEVTGLFRSTTASNIDEWHLAQLFATPPTLSEEFINDVPPMARILAAGELAVNQQYLADILIQRDATRAIPVFGTPATLGRF